MGEPMSNERNVFEAIGRLTDPGGMRLGARHITVSTVGVIPGIDRLSIAQPQVGLAVSFHAADDGLRNQLVPANRLWPLRDLEAAVTRWRERTHRRPSIEWAMIDGVNDSARQADLLAPIAMRLRAHVNLIPLNPTPVWPAQPSPKRRIEAFVRRLRDAGVNATVRDTRGRSIDAACGQLRLAHERRGAAGWSSKNPVPMGQGAGETVR
jgi:23S rRNA (adenine2503-C2)-methyltransferase